jgi:hypothetical protein
MNQHEEVLRRRIFLRRLPTGIDDIINRSIAAIESLLSNPVIDNDRRASLASSCSKTITQYKFDLLTLNLHTIQNIRRGHQLVLVELQLKLLQSDWPQAMKQVIENRRQLMVKRHEHYLKNKLQSFFDEAPMV